MYPASFEYFAPSSLEEALSVLERYGDEAKILAGGQSLIPLMKLRFASPKALVDLNGVDGLDELYEDNGMLNIGALVRHKTCERSELLRSRYGVLADAAPQISDPIVRNRGTVAGSLAHADPQGDWGSALLAAGAQVQVQGPDGTRTIPLDDFFLGPFTTALEPTEILTWVQVPDPGPRAGGAYFKLERKVGDFATVAVGVHVSFSNGNVERAGIALTGVGPRNIRAEAAEQALAGRALDDEAIAEAARLAAEAADPRDDIRGSAEYKRNVVRVFTERGLAQGRRREGGVVTETATEQAVHTKDVTATVNGQARSAAIETRLLLVHFIRETLGLTGTHIGCDTTSCGACTVLLDGVPVKSCTMFAVQADGHEITTVEGLAPPGGLHPVQEGFHEEHGLQCGFCTPGMMLTATALLAENPDPSEEEIRWAISGNICRCTGYQNIVKAVQYAAAKMREAS